MAQADWIPAWHPRASRKRRIARTFDQPKRNSEIMPTRCAESQRQVTSLSNAQLIFVFLGILASWLCLTTRWLVLTTPRTIWYGTRCRLERWLSGRKRRFAKPLYGSNCIGGSNPPLSAVIGMASPNPVEIGVSDLLEFAGIVGFDPSASVPLLPSGGHITGRLVLDAVPVRRAFPDKKTSRVGPDHDEQRD